MVRPSWHGFGSGHQESLNNLRRHVMLGERRDCEHGLLYALILRMKISNERETTYLAFSFRPLPP